jgi:D-aminopeptidase
MLSAEMGGWTVGALVQSNFGGVLTIAGAPVGRELGRYYLRNRLEAGRDDPRHGGRVDRSAEDRADGSIMIVLATDAPLSHRNLERLARRALAGLARTGSAMTNGSGDYVIAFSTVRASEAPRPVEVANDEMSPLFLAATEATEEAIYNSLLYATTVHGHRGIGEALPIDATLEILRRHGLVDR